MKTVLVILVLASLLTLTGCPSLQYAGVSHYRMTPVMLEGEPYCCELEIYNGKEIAKLDAKFVKKGDNVAITLKQIGVEAFQGQQISADVATEAIDGVIKGLAIP